MSKKVHITLQNNPAQPWTQDGSKPDSDSIIIAEVSVSGATGENLNYAQIEFEGSNASDVYFIDRDGTISTDKTKKIEILGNNTIEVKFTARKPFKSIIKGYVVVRGQMLPGSSDQQEFSFEVELDTLNLDIAPTDIYLGDKITAKASASAKGVPVANQWLTLDLNTNGPAKFADKSGKYDIDNNGYTLSGATGKDGFLNVEIEASQWGADSLTLSLYEGTGGHLAFVTKDFEINPPKDIRLDLIALSLCTSGGEWVACGSRGRDLNRILSYQGFSPANGVTPIKITGYLGRYSNIASHYNNVPLLIKVFGGATFVIGRCNDPDIVYLSDKELIINTSASGMTPCIELISQKECKGIIEISNQSIFYKVEASYEFFNPWNMVNPYWNSIIRERIIIRSTDDHDQYDNLIGDIQRIQILTGTVDA